MHVPEGSGSGIPGQPKTFRFNFQLQQKGHSGVTIAPPSDVDILYDQYGNYNR